MVSGRRQQITDYIREHFRSDLSIAEIARQLDMSESHLRAEFARESAQSPLAFLTELRMAYALELLQKGKYTIQEVARRVGIPSGPRFRRTFQRYYGFPPSRYRPEVEAKERVETALAGFKFTPPVPVDADMDHQLEMIWQGRMIRCSQEYATLLGAKKPADVIGVKLIETVAATDNTTKRHRDLIQNGYQAKGVIAHLRGLDAAVPALVTIQGIIRDGAMVETWGSAIPLEPDDDAVLTGENDR